MPILPVYGPLDTFTFETSLWRNLTKYQCLDCNWYVFRNEPQMWNHCRKTGHGLVKNGLMTIEEYIETHRNEPPVGVTVTLGYLCWNTVQASAEGAVALVREADRLRQLGCHAQVVILDNGSDDDTYWAIKKAVEGVDSVTVLRNLKNEGISRGRNFIIEVARTIDTDFLMLMDGDIEIVPLSSYVMARYLGCHPEVGCIGAYSANYTKDRTLAASKLIEIPESRVKDDVQCAWTQYGMFRGTMFEQGIRFNQAGAFGEPGWGFEDDDLFFQMMQKGWRNRYFSGMRYLHRNIRSSFPNLQKQGIDLETMFKKRQQYLVSTWSQLGLDSRILKRIEAQRLPR